MFVTNLTLGVPHASYFLSFSISSQSIGSFLTYSQDFVFALAFVSLLISFFFSLSLTLF